MFSDLREYIQNEVCVVPLLKRDTMRMISAALLLILGAGTIAFMALYQYAAAPREEMYASALQAQSSEEKLNFLIQTSKIRDQIPRAVYGVLFAFIIVTTVISTNILERWLRYLFPANEFLFGKRKSTFERRKSLLSKVFWGVGVALVVGILASLVVWQVTQ